MNATTTLATVDPAVVEYLKPACGDMAEYVAKRLPGLTVAMLKGLDALIRDCHGCQTEVEAAWDGGRLHYRATGPVLSSGALESWHVSDYTCVPYAQTHGVQWSGYRLADIHATSGDLCYHLATQAS